MSALDASHLFLLLALLRCRFSNCAPGSALADPVDGLELQQAIGNDKGDEISQRSTIHVRQYHHADVVLRKQNHVGGKPIYIATVFDQFMTAVVLGEPAHSVVGG